MQQTLRCHNLGPRLGPKRRQAPRSCREPNCLPHIQLRQIAPFPERQPSTRWLCKQRLAAQARTEESVTQFDVDAAPEPLDNGVDLGPRDDDVLPNSLANAIDEAARATAEAIQRGNNRCQVELHMPEFWDPISGPIFPNQGDQERFWRMTRRFLEQLATHLSCSGYIKAVYPDAGVAAMLSHRWPDRAFNIASLNDRRPVDADDELVVLACVDPPGAEDCMRVVRQVSEQDEQAGTPGRPVVLFNQRMSSGDVGLGLNSRRIRSTFLRDFTITYSLRSIGDVGTVFRRYPGLWKVFVEEEALPGRYRLIQESPSRPQGEALTFLIREALSPSSGGAAGEGEGAGGKQQPGLVEQLSRTLTSLNYFMRSLRN